MRSGWLRRWECLFPSVWGHWQQSGRTQPGTVKLSRYLDYINEDSQVSVSVAAGNEGAAQHHYTAELNDVRNQDTAELRISEGEQGFTMEFWGNPPDDYAVSIQSPAGENLYVSSSLGAGTQELSFVFVETKVLVNYVGMERQTGKQLIYFRFFHPAAGIWKMNVSKKKGASKSISYVASGAGIDLRGYVFSGIYSL